MTNIGFIRTQKECKEILTSSEVKKSKRLELKITRHPLLKIFLNGEML